MKTTFEKPFEKVLLFTTCVLLIVSQQGCESTSASIPVRPALTRTTPAEMKPTIPVKIDPVAILSRQQVPILCYHQIREFRATDSKRAKDYIVPVSEFEAQMKLLADNGYHSILPDQLYDYLAGGAPLPSNPIMISFDDTRAEQFEIGNTSLKKYGFKGVYFIMTVSLGRPGYMTREQVKQLADEGNTIGSHTWNHSNVKKYSGDDWSVQIDKPSQQLEKIIGQPIKYFAYPFGLWNREAAEQLDQRHYKAAFQLTEKRDDSYPQFTVRRMIVPGEWNLSSFEKRITSTFSFSIIQKKLAD